MGHGRRRSVRGVVSAGVAEFLVKCRVVTSDIGLYPSSKYEAGAYRLLRGASFSFIDLTMSSAAFNPRFVFSK